MEGKKPTPELLKFPLLKLKKNPRHHKKNSFPSITTEDYPGNQPYYPRDRETVDCGKGPSCPRSVWGQETVGRTGGRRAGHEGPACARQDVVWAGAVLTRPGETTGGGPETRRGARGGRGGDGGDPGGQWVWLDREKGVPLPGTSTLWACARRGQGLRVRTKGHGPLPFRPRPPPRPAPCGPRQLRGWRW